MWALGDQGPGYPGYRVQRGMRHRLELERGMLDCKYVNLTPWIYSPWISELSSARSLHESRMPLARNSREVGEREPGAGDEGVG